METQMSQDPPQMDKKWGGIGLVLALGALGAWLGLDSPLNMMVGIPLLLGCVVISKKAMPPQG